MSAADSPLAPLPSLEALYTDHHGWLRGWLRKKLGNAFDAADIAHDTYLRLMVSGRSPQAEQSRPFLTQIANGLVIDLHRRRRLEAAYLETLCHLPEPALPSEEQKALVLEALIEIDTILHALSGKARMALLMFKLDGLSYREIAGRLGVSQSSVEKYIAAGFQACYQACMQGLHPGLHQLPG
ncbi:sigma-70 family RNA polymerase sigma factor [Herbaspirillum lusitanum]|uniref:Sigma-70 family RNA polymerase sigma factor n=1 Tax=Herbaspirillum lusitanum TaxID=213312 RepID=A0ABW9A944_9BURK